LLEIFTSLRNAVEARVVGCSGVRNPPCILGIFLKL
jgi:hypothetical protein